MQNPVNRPSTAALTALIILQLIMLGALYAQSVPHPPNATPLFAIAPFLGASLSAAACALIMGATTSRAGKVLSLIAALGALISFGPQKYIDPNFHLIWPAVIAGQLAVLTIARGIFRTKQ